MLNQKTNETARNILTTLMECYVAIHPTSNEKVIGFMGAFKEELVGYQTQDQVEACIETFDKQFKSDFILAGFGMFIIEAFKSLEKEWPELSVATV